jgi:hypothetical protein
MSIACAGCASIPKESVELNAIVGQALAKQNEAQIALVNKYFALKRQRVNDFVQQTFIPRFIKNAAKEAQRSDFNEEAVQFLVKEAVLENLRLLDTLETSRISVIEKINSE